MSEQTPTAIAYMRKMYPTIKFFWSPKGLDFLASQGQKVNWAYVNDVEKACGLPITQMPNHPAVFWEGPNEETESHNGR